MVADVATLGIRVDTREVKGADRDLDNLAKTGTNTEKSIGGLTNSTNLLSIAMRALPTLAIGAVLSGAITKAKEFSNSMAEISTLVDTTKFNMDGLTSSILDQSKAYNSTPFAQSRAAYQIISAGATTAAEATETLTAANKLAVGGVTDVATAADGLTSVMNAYGDRIASAADASDAMFTAVKAGKTTIGELSASLGAVAPLAAQLGVTFDELTAATAALTKGGVQTSVATTGLRAILAAVAKPSDEAAKLAAKLGIEFNSAAIQAKGFAGFLEDLKAKTHGNSDALAILFGGVEALVPVMALTGQAGSFFSEIMVGMGEKTGATGEAFDKIAAGPAYRIGVIVSSLSASAIEAGTAFLNFLNPALGALAGVLSGATEPGWALDAALKAVAVTAGVVAVRAIVGMTSALVASATAWIGASQAVLLFQMNLARYGAGVALATVATTGLAGAARGLLALVGGPLGIALGLVAGAIYLIYKNTTTATPATAKYTDATAHLAEIQAKAKGATDALTGATGEARKAAIRNLSALTAEANGYLQVARAALIAAQAKAQAAATEAKVAATNTQNDFGEIGRGRIAPNRLEFNKKREAAMQAAANRDAALRNVLDATKATESLSGQLNAASAPVNTVKMPTLDLNTDSPKSNKGGGAKADKISDAQREREQAIKSAKDYAESLAIETSEIGKNSIQTKMMAAEREAAKAPTVALKDAILASAEAWKKANNAERISKMNEALADEAEAIKFETSLIGMSNEERMRAIKIRSISIQILALERDGYTEVAEGVRNAANALADLEGAKGKKLDIAEQMSSVTDGMRDAASAVRDMTEGFGELFGTAGEGFSNLINTIFEYGEAQAEIAEKQSEIQNRYSEGVAMNSQDQSEFDRLGQESARNRIASYGNMIGAAKSFFKEGSTGYKILEGAERAYRLFQFAMQVKAILMDTVQTGASVANSATRASASGVEAVAKAMASLPPPLNFIAAGAVIAFLVAMGVKMVGGKGKGGGSSSGVSSGSSNAAKAVETYKGPRDQYGAPTSSYSVLRPGATTVANDNVTPYGAPANGASFTGGNITIQIQGGADMRTINEQVVPLLDQYQAKTVQDARQAVAADMAAKSGRQRIGGQG